MKYDFKCANKNCSEFDKVKEFEMRASEYVIPKCEKCGEEIKRIYISLGIKTNDGYKK